MTGDTVNVEGLSYDDVKELQRLGWDLKDVRQHPQGIPAKCIIPVDEEVVGLVDLPNP